MTIRWERQFGDGWFAYSGPTWRSNIGMVVPRDDGTVAWQIDAVSMSRVGRFAKGYGETRSVRTAKLALERNWTKWLKTFNLS